MIQVLEEECSDGAKTRSAFPRLSSVRFVMSVV